MRGGCCAITLAGRGEPLLNPDICSFLEYAANKFMELKINTNGLLLTDEVSHAILRSNVSLVVFSAEGTTQETYERTRCGGKFSRLIENIRQFNDIRSNYYKKSKTQTRVSGVIVDKAMNKEEYYNFWKSLVDEVALVELEERWNTYENAVFVTAAKPCNRLWHQMYIWWDGKCAVCDNDYLTKIEIGKVDENQTIRDVWNGEVYNKIRKFHLNGQRNECFPCDRCGL
ncbi:MAG: SPASM domain-containing protein [Blautia sp.]|nr:SPASM domain-containing protein [Blautia sp.]MCM1200784.1 SPASM domain-containing protein [Bacteroides fragilis]